MTRACDGCTKCCEGWLRGSTLGYEFYPGRPCFFLNKSCSIYESRPQDPCRSYQCLWLNDMQFPEWMKPDLVNVIINKASFKNINYYILVEAGSSLNVRVLSWMIQWALNNSQNLMYYIDGGRNRIGSKEFLEMSVET